MGDKILVVDDSLEIREILEKKDGGIDKVFLYRDKEEKGNRSYTNMLDVITDLLPSEWKKKQTFSVDANIKENPRLYR